MPSLPTLAPVRIIPRPGRWRTKVLNSKWEQLGNTSFVSCWPAPGPVLGLFAERPRLSVVSVSFPPSESHGELFLAPSAAALSLLLLSRAHLRAANSSGAYGMHDSRARGYHNTGQKWTKEHVLLSAPVAACRPSSNVAATALQPVAFRFRSTKAVFLCASHSALVPGPTIGQFSGQGGKWGGGATQAFHTPPWTLQNTRLHGVDGQAPPAEVLAFFFFPIVSPVK